MAPKGRRYTLKNVEHGRHQGCYGLDSDVAHKCLVSLPCRRRPCKVGSRRDQAFTPFSCVVIHNTFSKNEIVDGSLRVMITRQTNSRTICVEQILPQIPCRKRKDRNRCKQEGDSGRKSEVQISLQEPIL